MLYEVITGGKGRPQDGCLGRVRVKVVPESCSDSQVMSPPMVSAVIFARITSYNVCYTKLLRGRQFLAIGLAVAGVLNLLVSVGHLPWVALSLAASFA